MDQHVADLGIVRHGKAETARHVEPLDDAGDFNVVGHSSRDGTAGAGVIAPQLRLTTHTHVEPL